MTNNGFTVVIFLITLFILPESVLVKALTAEICPTRVSLQQVSHRYPPPNLATRLFSSVPRRREYAVHKISLDLLQDLVILKGSSSSGKSTLLKLIHQELKPCHGSIEISTTVQTPMNAKPILLDQRPVLESSRKVRDVIEQRCQTFRYGKKSAAVIQQALLADLGPLFGIDNIAGWMETRTFDLSPSEQYKCELVAACMESMLPTVTIQDGSTVLRAAAPILLLDEWLDTEPSITIQAVQTSLWDLVQKRGATVCVATHYTERWSPKHMSRAVTLEFGEILHETLSS